MGSDERLIERLQRPTLVLAPNKTLAAQLAGEFRELLPNNAVEYFVSYYDYYQPEAYIPQSDTFIEKDSSINDEIDKLRHSATAALPAVPRGPGFQVGYAGQVRAATGMPTMAVGLITEARHAEGILRDGQADFVALARSMGCDAARVSRCAELAPALQRALGHDLRGAQGVAAMHEIHRRGEASEIRGLLARGVAATHHDQMLVPEDRQDAARRTEAALAEIGRAHV